MWAEQGTARRQERKGEQEMLRFPLDVRCASVPDTLALFSPTRVRSGQKENNLALSRYSRELE